MTSFDAAVAIVLRFEGGWVNDPRDPGGETAFGISMRFIKAQGLTAAALGLENLEPGCLKKLERTTAAGLYRRYFWDAGGYGMVTDQLVATSLFDCAVNCGLFRAAVLAQQVLHELGVTTAAVAGGTKGVEVDGKFGALTAAAINSCSQTAFRKAYRAARERFYRDLVARKPEMKAFLESWLHRAAWPDPPTPV